MKYFCIRPVSDDPVISTWVTREATDCSLNTFWDCFIPHRFLPSKSLNDSFWAIFRPTNGAFTLFLALHTCDTVSLCFVSLNPDAKVCLHYNIFKLFSLFLLSSGERIWIHDWRLQWILQLLCWKRPKNQGHFLREPWLHSGERLVEEPP